MPDASPTKWHRAHVTWFFEQFLLKPYVKDYRPFDERFAYLYNSYYVVRRTARGAAAARPGDAAERGRGRRLSRACRCRGSGADRDDAAISTKSFRSSRSGSITSNSIRNCCSPNFARLLAQRDASGLRSGLAMAAAPTKAPLRRRRCRRPRYDRPRRRRLLFRQRTAGASDRAAAGAAFAARWSPMASGSISWPTAATRRRRCGCRTVGRPSRRKAGTRRAIGARSTARGSR